MDPSLTLSLVVGVIFVATLTRSTFGFGDGLIAMPLLSMIMGIQVAAPLVALVSTTIAMTIIATDWRKVHFQSAARLVLASIVGIPVGILFLTDVDEQLVKGILAGTIILFSAYAITKPTLLTLQTDRSAFVFGFFAGILGGAYNTPGPLLVLFGTLRRWHPEHFRATLQGYFLPTGICILIGHAIRGTMSREVLWLYLYALPLVFIAVVTGRVLNRRFHLATFVRFVHLALIGIGVVLLVDLLCS